MARLESALKRLAEGCVICPVHYPEEFELLEDPNQRRRAEEWLEAIGYRLARLSEEGAYVMAHSVVTTEMRNQFREELRNVRFKLEPVVGFLETLRQSLSQGGGDNFRMTAQIHPGDTIWESEITEAVRKSSILERRLMEMRDMSGVRVTESAPDRVRRMLNLLVQDGYLVEVNPTTKGYQVTGKIEYLYQLIAFIAENSTHVSDDDVVDQIDPQLRLDAAAGAPEMAAGEGGQP